MKKEIGFRLFGLFLVIFGLYFFTQYFKSNSAFYLEKYNYVHNLFLKNDSSDESLIDFTCWQNRDFLIIDPILDFYQYSPEKRALLQKKYPTIDDLEEFDIIVRNKWVGYGKVACKPSREKGDLIIEKEGPVYIFHLEDNFLFIDYGTTRLRSFSIFNLKDGKEYFSDRYTRGVKISKENDNIIMRYLTFIDHEKEATRENCPEYDQYEKEGFGAGLNQYIELNVNTLERKAGKIECSARE